MNIIVCIKKVPDTETAIKIAADGKSIDSAGVKFIISPYDEIAVEQALQFKEKAGSGEVTIVSYGNVDTAAVIRNGLAMGADKAVHVKDDAKESDSYSTAVALANAIKPLHYDLVLFGKQAIDDDSAQVGNMTAHLLDIPFVGVVTKIEPWENRLVCHREVEGGHEIVEVSMPCAISCQKGLCEPRYPSLKGIMAAKKKPLEEKTPEKTAPVLIVSKLEYPPSRPPGRIVGQGAEAVPELVNLLHNEAKII